MVRPGIPPPHVRDVCVNVWEQGFVERVLERAWEARDPIRGWGQCFTSAGARAGAMTLRPCLRRRPLALPPPPLGARVQLVGGKERQGALPPNATPSARKFWAVMPTSTPLLLSVSIKAWKRHAPARGTPTAWHSEMARPREMPNPRKTPKSPRSGPRQAPREVSMRTREASGPRPRHGGGMGSRALYIIMSRRAACVRACAQICKHACNRIRQVRVAMTSALVSDAAWIVQL